MGKAVRWIRSFLPSGRRDRGKAGALAPSAAATEQDHHALALPPTTAVTTSASMLGAKEKRRRTARPRIRTGGSCRTRLWSHGWNRTNSPSPWPSPLRPRPRWPGTSRRLLSGYRRPRRGPSGPSSTSRRPRLSRSRPSSDPTT
ncbi:hypothetical protein ACP4OV_018015 [Aristida adscensionis]